MATFTHMTDMTRTAEEKVQDMFPSAMANTPDVPYGLCNCITETEMEKLDLDDDVEVGDYLHGRVMWKVTAVNKSDHGNGVKCRVEMSIVAMSVLENESTEDPTEESYE